MDKNKLRLLSRIRYPEDLRHLSVEELPELCRELREDIVDELSVNPGHLASSLGVVELTVALHYVFDTPYDRIVWDVGHQAYGHKILTGRRDCFCTNRKLKGLRPFPSPLESEYDTFTCGHASNSISAALGMAVAAKKTGHDDRHVVAVIGDGAMSGGLAFEGINNVSSSPNDLLIILNDNDMSIDRAVGGMEQYLLNLDTNATYNRLRYRVSRWLHSKGYLNDNRRKGIIRLNNALKSALSHQQNIFEGMNIRYFGPFDGHDVAEVVRLLRQLKDMKGPKLLHLHTTKGKGYEPAEKEATIWHAPGKFDPETGERLDTVPAGCPPRYQDVFGEVLCELAAMDPKVVGITPAMAQGCGMTRLAAERPGQFFDVGIEEEHAVTFAAGLAAAGMKPFCNIYSSFAQRAYDEVIHDVALQNLPVTLCLDRAGLVGEDGATHHGTFDLAAFRCIPNAIVCSPRDETELKNLMYSAWLSKTGPYIIRYPRGMGEGADWKNAAFTEIPAGSAETLAEGSEIAVVATGPAVNRALEAAAAYPGKVGVYNFRFIKPLDEGLLAKIAGRCRQIITVEDGSLKGGLYGAVCEYLMSAGFPGVRVHGIGVPDVFVNQARQQDQLEEFGISRRGIEKKIEKVFEEEK